MSTSLATGLDVERVRADFPILQTRLHGDGAGSGVPLVYLDNAASSQRPRQVIQAIVDCYEQHYANVHRGIHWLSDRSTDLYEQARQKVQAFVGASSPEEIIFTSGTTAAINLVARSWGDSQLHAGDEILLTEMEHHANIVPWQQLAERTGAVLKYIPITDDGRLRLESLDELLTARTRLVAVTAISNVLGTINPLQEIVRRAHAAGALVLVDAAQSVAHGPTNVRQLDVDFLAFSGHKMLGPSGVGVLYGKRELLEKMPPFLGGGSMIRRVRLEGFEPADLPARFEAGTPAIVPAIALGTAIDYLNHWGWQAIGAHEDALCQRAHEVLAAFDRVRILGPAPAHKGAIVSFTIDGVHAHDVAQVLDQRGVAVRAGHHCTMPLHKRLNVMASSRRASFAFYNTLGEVDVLGEAITDVLKLFRRRG